MKNFTLVLFIAMLFLGRIAANASTFDNSAETEIYNAFTEIENVMDYISTNDDVSYTDLIINNFNTANLSSSAAIATSMSSNDGEPPFLSPFWWGCIFGPVGIVVVAVTSDNNKEYIRKSALGCAIPVGCTLISWIAYAIIGLSTATMY